MDKHTNQLMLFKEFSSKKVNVDFNVAKFPPMPVCFFCVKPNCKPVLLTGWQVPFTITDIPVMSRIKLSNC